MTEMTWREFCLKCGPGGQDGEYAITSHKKPVRWVTVSRTPPAPISHDATDLIERHIRHVEEKPDDYSLNAISRPGDCTEVPTMILGTLAPSAQVAPIPLISDPRLGKMNPKMAELLAKVEPGPSPVEDGDCDFTPPMPPANIRKLPPAVQKTHFKRCRPDITENPHLTDDEKGEQLNDWLTQIGL